MGAMAQIARSLFTPQGGALSYGVAKQGFRELVTRDPIDTLIVAVLGGGYLFYLAEKGKNPRVNTIWDAFVFVATALSVGYDQTFARTDSGKAIAAFVMTFGPAAATAAFDPPAREAEAQAAEALATQKAILERLDGILETLKKLPAEPSV